MSDTDLTALFQRRKAGIDCSMCPDATDHDVVAELPSGKVHLQNDADYKGYCILVFRRHAIEIHELTSQERYDWIEDIARIGRAVTEVCSPAKLNVSMLGNLCPHLHCHVMPRYVGDPEWVGPPAFRAVDQRTALSPEEFAALHQALKTALN
ncbi:MAG: histidine triad [Chthonomonadaceae bacterium]|nr:histidine triad [Chthonomonadaceae bacterium]